jgi:hypothetical protein
MATLYNLGKPSKSQNHDSLSARLIREGGGYSQSDKDLREMLDLGVREMGAPYCLEIIRMTLKNTYYAW